MKTIYIDSDYMCHLESAPDRQKIETDIFDNMIDEVIPFYRFIPQGHEWVNPKTGVVLHGLFVQSTNDEQMNKIIVDRYMLDMQNALDILGVNA